MKAIWIFVVPSPSLPVATRVAARSVTAAGIPSASIEYARLPVQPAAAVTPIVTGNVPVAVGVPESSPPAVSESPGGKTPDVTAKVNGALPALAVNV